MIHEHEDIVMVEVPEDAIRFNVFENCLWWTNPKAEKTKQVENDGIEVLPTLEGDDEWEIVGLSSKLSEDEWEEIVEKEIDYGYVNYNNVGKLLHHFKPQYGTATESGLSLLKSKNLSPDTTLILKKQKI